MIITQLDAAYSPWLEVFLSSLRLTNPDLPTSVELVNFERQLVDHFATRYPGTSFRSVELQNPSRTVLAHRKVETAIAALEHHPQQPWYLLCDVDLLFRDSIDELIATILSHDAAVIFRDGWWEGRRYEHLRVNTSLVGFRDARLLEDWRAAMEEPSTAGYDSGSWFYDQVTLWSTTQRLPLRYGGIDDRRFLNRDLEADALIWSAHLEPKVLMYLRFLEERDRLSARRSGPADLARGEEPRNMLGEAHPDST